MQDRGKELDPARHRFHLDGSRREIAGITDAVKSPPGPQPPKQGANPYTPPQAYPPTPQYGPPANPPPAAQAVPRFPPLAAAGAGAGSARAGESGTPGYPGQPMDGTTSYAGWGTRFVAYLIDCLILGTAAVIFVFVLAFILVRISAFLGISARGGLIWLIPYLVMYGAIVAAAVWYFPYHWSESGQTICQKMMHVKVVREDGSLPSLGRSILRYIVGMGILDSILFGLPIGWLWPLWDAKKQAWHDKIAGTIVIKVQG
jgi:uncharacterized RDD family membrane protein YckC